MTSLVLELFLLVKDMQRKQVEELLMEVDLTPSSLQ